jgi:predicted RNA-binding Zn-ribbon protein involved in translation (DUF1610 family)
MIPRPPRPPCSGEPPRPPRDPQQEDETRVEDEHPPSAAEPDGHEAPAPATEAAPRGPRTFGCDQCGAELTYQPGTTELTCQYCGHANQIPQSADDIHELDFERHLAALEDAETTEEHATLHCDGCGANVDRPANVTAFECPFCGANINLTTQIQRLIRPRALLPFKVEQAEAQARFRNWLRKLWFAPNKLKQFARLNEKLRGVYVPYWTYDSKTVTHYTGERGEDYYVTVGSGKNRRRVRRTRWYHASGVVWNRFDDVLVLGSRSLPERYADELEPWDLGSLVDYDDAYLTGFTAESYQIDLKEGFGRARLKMDPIIRDTVRHDIGGDRQRIHSLKTEYRNVTFKHILLPVWISAYHFRDKVYRFLVNARTGEVQGERPWSAWKIALTVLAAAAVVGTLVYVFRGELL